MSSSDLLFSVRNLCKGFEIAGQTIQALDRVSFDIKKGQIFGLVGESGCGKSTLARCLLGLLPLDSGSVHLYGREAFSNLQELRRKVQMVFQDSHASLNPRMNVEAILSEPLEVHRVYGDKKQRADRLLQLLELCGLPRQSLQRFPHEFSGGQRQRICIARALAVQPDLLICDESVSALDVSIQAQILNLLKDLRDELALSYLMISHDLRVIRHMSDQVAVMYLGRIVELSPATQLFENPRHPYTCGLIATLPSISPKKRARAFIEGEPPSLFSSPSACHFHPRCQRADDLCRRQRPEMMQNSSESWLACHHCQSPDAKP